MRAVVAALGVGLAVGQGIPGECLNDYDSIFLYTDPIFSTTWKFDFSKLCNDAVDYVAVDNATNFKYYFNIGGYANEKCLPTYPERYLYGAAVQVSGPPPDCNTTKCFNPLTNATECCTGYCNVLGTGTPIWGVRDPYNLQSGGVTLTYYGVPPADAAPYKCGNDKNGNPISRSVQINLLCTRAQVELQIINVTETATCRYEINALSYHACGCESACTILGTVLRNCGDDGCGGYCSSAPLQGDCPYVNNKQQICSDVGVCCRPDCDARTCGDDGCGGSCGTCGAGQVCSGAQVCVSTVTPGPQFGVLYTSVGGSIVGSFFGGIGATLGCAGLFMFFLGGGRERFDRWRFAGESAGSGLLSGGARAQPPPGSSISQAASGGGYGSGAL